MQVERKKSNAMVNNLVYIVRCILMVRDIHFFSVCTILSNIYLECTYDQPSNRKRIPDIRNVENKLKCAEMVVQSILPGIDIYNPSFDINSFMESAKLARQKDPSLNPFKLANKSLATSTIAKDISKIRQSQQQIQQHQSQPNDDYFSPLSTSNSNINSPMENGYNGKEIKIILPPKHVASELIEAVWDNACVLFRFYHRPSFIRDLDLLYETDPDDYTSKQYKILPLVYSVMAVGVLFSMDKCEKLGFKDASEGYKYFVAARKLIDIADARDTYAIQSIVMMIIFLQCSARLSTCYSYIGVALRSALRAGLHRKVAYNFNPIELETRKRLFWTIRKMDIYVNAMLGLPRSTSESDFDQELPEEIDDENITEDAYFPQQKGKLSSAGIANAHTRLITILSHIMKHIYPVKPDEMTVSNAAPLYNVTQSKVAEMEREIRAWLESLPVELRPGANPPPEYLKANRLLHLALCHIQIVLYRPFIHYCSPKYNRDEKARLFALNCIGVSRRAMYLAHELTSQKLLNGAYWFSIYTIFFSVACLVFYVHENPTDPEALDIRRDAELGKNALTSLKDSSTAAKRTHNLLNTLFEQLNRRTAKRDSDVPTENRYQPPEYDSQAMAMPEINPLNVTVDNPTPISSSSNVNNSMAQPSKRGRKPKARNSNGTISAGLTSSIAADSVNGFPINSSNSPTPAPSVPTSRTESPHFYVPGIMDQVDAQLFGRFLPPYMLQQQHHQPSQHTDQPQSDSQQSQQQQLPNEWNDREAHVPITNTDPPALATDNNIEPNLNLTSLSDWDNNSFGLNPKFTDNNTNPPTDTSTTSIVSGPNDTSNQGETNTNLLISETDPNMGTGMGDERRLSLSSLFAGGKDWEDLISQHSELSGLNSFMFQ